MDMHAMRRNVFTDASEGSIHYRTCDTGDWKQPQKAVLLLFFHGAGERGNDNEKQLVHGAREIVAYCEKNNIKARLLFPQCPEDKKWVDTPWEALSHKLPPESAMMKRAMSLLETEMRSPEIDPARIYIVGISMGGFGTWDALSRHPERFAAALPVCGGADVEMASRLKNIPIRTCHGAEDGVVFVCRSRDIVAAIRAAGGDKITYNEIPGAGHDVWTATFGDDATWNWLFAQKRCRGETAKSKKENEK